MIKTLIVVFIIIASVSEAIMDTLAHHFEKSIFSKLNPKFWNPVVSGANKWKNGDKLQGERFPLSSTLLVGFTEAWHLFKMIRTFFIFAIIGVFEFYFYKSIIITIFLRVIFGGFFTCFYSYIFKLIKV